MASRIGKYKVSKKESNLSIIDGGSAVGEVNLQKVKVGAAHADGATLTVAESGQIFIESTNGATVTLPATQKGLTYTFVWGGTAGHTFNISPNASDKIMGSIIDSNAIATIVEGGTNGAGVDNKDLQLDSGSGVGDRVTLLGDGDAGWIIVEGIGSWAFES
tara:strand:+ start:41 stop:523 length:483 start_codon:yes stop_codon:yes gene_type:complete